MSISEYRILEANTLAELLNIMEPQVNNMLRDGWCLRGPLQVSGAFYAAKFTQTLVKYSIPSQTESYVAYKILYRGYEPPHDTPQIFAQRVTDLLKKGWLLYGDLCRRPVEGFNYSHYIQVFVK